MASCLASVRLARAAVRSWPESLGRAIGLEFEDDKAGALGPVWADAFPGSYREDYEIEEAIQDLKRCEELWGRDPDLPAEVRVAQTEDGQVRLNIYLTQSLSLTELLPLLHNMGLRVLDQRPYTVTPADGREFQLYDFGVELLRAEQQQQAPEERRAVAMCLQLGDHPFGLGLRRLDMHDGVRR